MRDNNSPLEHLADEGGDRVARALGAPDVSQVLAGRVARGRRRRVTTQGASAFLAVGVLGLGAWAVAPMLADDSTQPAGDGFAMTVDDSIAFLGRTDGEPWGPSWFECGDLWEMPAEAGITVPADGVAVPMLREVVTHRTGLGEWERVFPGDTVALESMPAVVSFVSWEDPASEPAAWGLQTFGALVNDDGVVMGVAFEHPPGFQEPVGPDAEPGEQRVQADLDLHYCPEVMLWDPEAGSELQSADYLDGTFSLHTVTQVYSAPQPDGGTDHEVLATFVNYERSEPFELSVDATVSRQQAEDREDRVARGKELLAAEIEQRGVPLTPGALGVRPQTTMCEAVDVARDGRGNVPVVPVTTPVPDLRIVPWDGAPQLDDEASPQWWLNWSGGDNDTSWWAAYVTRVILYDQAGEMVAALYSDGTVFHHPDERLLYTALGSKADCAFGDVAPGTYNAVVISAGPVANSSYFPGYSAGYETWMHLGEVTLTD